MKAQAPGGSQVLKNLREFITKAEKLGKYPRNTVIGLLAAVRVVEEGLLPDEPDDPMYITEHLEEIYNRQMSKLNLTAASVETYIGRVKRALTDYHQYGSDPKAFLAWKPRIIQRAPRSRPKETKPSPPEVATEPAAATAAMPAAPANSNRLKMLVWSLRPDLNIQIQLPVDMNQKDVERLTKLLRLEAELSES
ncbi:MAG: hypothetical protein L0214_05340 [candidate division NC10 bacterium]|nr:hypothetical protein [candidate division NC10 bacterium]